MLIFNYNKFPVSPGAALFRTSDLKNSILIDIPNPHNTDFSIYGAGNDLLIFLLTAIKYNKIRISNNATAYFRYHDDSFTIANDLFFYYEFAKYYFISNFKTELLSLYKFSLRWNFRKSEKNHFHEIFNVKIKLKDKIFFFKKKLLYKMKTKYISYEWRK